MTALSKRRDWRIPGALWERIVPGRFARAPTSMRLLRIFRLEMRQLIDSKRQHRKA